MTDAEKLHALATSAGPFLAELLASTGGDVHAACVELEILRRGLVVVRESADVVASRGTPRRSG